MGAHRLYIVEYSTRIVNYYNFLITTLFWKETINFLHVDVMWKGCWSIYLWNKLTSSLILTNATRISKPIWNYKFMASMNIWYSMQLCFECLYSLMLMLHVYVCLQIYFIMDNHLCTTPNYSLQTITHIISCYKFIWGGVRVIQKLEGGEKERWWVKTHMHTKRGNHCISTYISSIQH